jgi:hypothetical protein
VDQPPGFRRGGGRDDFFTGGLDRTAGRLPEEGRALDGLADDGREVEGLGRADDGRLVDGRLGTTVRVPLRGGVVAVGRRAPEEGLALPLLRVDEDGRF